MFTAHNNGYVCNHVPFGAGFETPVARFGMGKGIKIVTLHILSTHVHVHVYTVHVHVHRAVESDSYMWRREQIIVKRKMLSRPEKGGERPREQFCGP